MDIGNGNLCFHVCEAVPFAKDQTPLCRNSGYCPVKMKPDQNKVFLLLLGLPINPLYLRLARTSPFHFLPEKGQAPGMVRSKLTTILSPNTQGETPAHSLVCYKFCFSPALFFYSCQATCVTRVSGKKKVFKKPLARTPNLFLESVFFFFQNKKAAGKNRQYWGVGVCF